MQVCYNYLVSMILGSSDTEPLKGKLSVASRFACDTIRIAQLR